MKLRILTLIALVFATGLTVPKLGISQPSPTGQYQPGFWQPEAQIDNTRDIKIRFLNETGLNLEFGQAGINLYSLPAGRSAEMSVRISNRTGDIANIPVNVQQGTTPLKYAYNVDGDQNLVTVLVRVASDRERQDRAVYIDERGRVYSF